VGRARPRIHWCPTGAFTFVPIHAAGIYEGSSQECCSDFMVSSYTPTLSALVQAQRSKLTLTPDEVVLLAIAADDPDDSSMPRLPHVTRETEDIINIARDAGASCILDSSKAARSKLRVANLVHFACHGIQHATEPHRSQFCLSDGRLSVTDLMKMNLERAFCAFLSACETATGDPEHADEVVHLAATMLCVGFRSVVATMW
jgi:CHAT domain-containing protein